MLNLDARDICEKTTVTDLLKQCGEIAKFSGKKTALEQVLEKAQLEQHGSSAILQAAVKSRWGTWAKLVSSVSKNEESIKSALWAPGIQKDTTLKNEAERLRRQLCDSEDFWADVKDVDKMLAPLASAITASEGNEVNSRRCYKKIREAFSSSRAAIEDSGFMSFVKEELIEILDNREEFGKTDVAYLLDLLEPSDRGEELNSSEKQKAIELLASKCLKNPVFVGREGEVMTESAHWLAGTGAFSADKRSYAWDAVNIMDGLTWWKAWFSDLLPCKVVQMLHNVPISAAPTERNWSPRGNIHTKLRNRMKVDTVNQIVFIKHNLQLEYGKLFKAIKDVDEADEEETEEE